MTVLMRIHVSCFAELENHELMKAVMEKIAKLFPAYLMSPANRETFVVYGGHVHIWNYILFYGCTCQEIAPIKPLKLILVNHEFTNLTAS